MNTTQRSQHLNVFLAAIFIALALAVIVLVALGLGVLWSLIGGFAVIGGVAIALGLIVAKYIVIPFLNAKVKVDSARYDHIEHMAKLGYAPIGAGYEPLQLPEPPEDVSVSLRGVTAEQLAEFKVHAVNLLALSKQVMGETSQQVLPSYRATENDYFKDGISWTSAVQYLIANSIAVERYKQGKNGKRKIGTFLIAGTVGQAYDALRGA